MGVIPISLSKKSEMLSKSVYPLNKRTLSWYEEKEIINDAVASTAFYNEVVNLLKRRHV